MRLVTAAATAAAALLLAGCGSSATLARVGGESITKAQVDQLVARGKDEAGREDRAFPSSGSPAYRAIQQEALGMLVTQAQVEAAAKRLGIAVTDAQVQANVQLPVERKDRFEALFEGAKGLVGAGEDEPDKAVLERDVRMELTLRALERRVGASRLAAWIAQARKATPVTYAGGWAPAP
jgi:hypothetical protein